jgi:hypothetical protein
MRRSFGGPRFAAVRKAAMLATPMAEAPSMRARAVVLAAALAALVPLGAQAADLPRPWEICGFHALSPASTVEDGPCAAAGAC